MYLIRRVWVLGFFILFASYAEAQTYAGVLEVEGLALNTKLFLQSKDKKTPICFERKWLNIAKFKGATFEVVGKMSEGAKCIVVESFNPIKTRLGHTVLKGVLTKTKDSYQVKDQDMVYRLGKIPKYMTKLVGKKVYIGVKQDKEAGKNDRRYSIFSVRQYPYE